MPHEIIRILDINTSIQDGRQIIELISANQNSNMSIEAEAITHLTNIHITEIEILIGSSLRKVYYEIGEITKNKTRCTKEKTIFKNYEIHKSGDIEFMRIKNLSKLLYFNRIRNIFKSSKNNKDFYIVELNNLTSFLSNENELFRHSQLLPIDYKLLNGEFVSPVFYQEGEVLQDGYSVVQKSNKLLKNLNLRITDSFENMRKGKSSFYS